jgi:hypothetical protein
MRMCVTDLHVIIRSKWSGVHKKENWGHRNNLDNSNFPDDEHVENYRVCVQSCFHGDLESELEDDVVQQVDKVFTEIITDIFL